MSNFDDILFKLQQEIEHKIFESIYKMPNTIMAADTMCNNGFLKDQLDRLLDEYLKNKVELKISPYVYRNEVIVVDCEEIRKEFPSTDMRGKLILCNPADYGKLKEYGF